MIDIKNKKLICKHEMIRVMENINIDELCRKYHINRNQVIYREDNLKAGDIVLIAYPDSIVHIVMPTQSIEDIALKYNVTPEYILQKNGCKKIFLGQILYI